ncbi:SLC13 family permease [Salinibaculum salinum]|uniref:SLC13 family permease n=1 Tax=Salinibaculum salinum TaxID=3131996 RepID=UPI0030EF3EE5
MSATDAIAGFASPAVVTIVAMYILGQGIQTAGVVDWLGARLARATRGSDRNLLGVMTATTGVFAGLVNNTPVVAIFIPMTSELADDRDVSPSKFLLPLSFAALLAAVITPVATVVLLGPIAVDLDASIGADGFSFLLATLFGASAAFITPSDTRPTSWSTAPADTSSPTILSSASHCYSC